LGNGLRAPAGPAYFGLLPQTLDAWIERFNGFQFIDELFGQVKLPSGQSTGRPLKQLVGYRLSGHVAGQFTLQVVNVGLNVFKLTADIVSYIGTALLT
jgi:hypothetical protein